MTQSFEAVKVKEIVISGAVGEVRFFPLKGKNIEVRSVFGASHQKIAEASKLQAELKQGKLSIESFQPPKLLEKSGISWWSTLVITIPKGLKIDIKTDAYLKASNFVGGLNAQVGWNKIYCNNLNFKKGGEVDIINDSHEGILLTAKSPEFWEQSRVEARVDNGEVNVDQKLKSLFTIDKSGDQKKLVRSPSNPLATIRVNASGVAVSFSRRD